MTRQTTVSIASQLRHANQLIANTRTNPEILSLVARRGYAENALDEGQRLYDAAVKAVDTQNARAGAQRYATEQARLAERAARVAYHELVQGVRALFGPNAPERKALDVSGKPTVAATDFLAAATTLFNNALELGDIGATLAQYGYERAALLEGREAVLAYGQRLQLQANTKSGAMHATATQTQALDALHRWTAQYAKFARIALRGRPDLLSALGLGPQRKAVATRITT